MSRRTSSKLIWPRRPNVSTPPQNLIELEQIKFSIYPGEDKFACCSPDTNKTKKLRFSELQRKTAGVTVKQKERKFGVVVPCC